MYCPNCGEKKESTDKFCSACGYKIYDQSSKFSSTTKPSKSNLSSREIPAILLGVFAIIFIESPIISIPLSIMSILIGRRLNKNNSSPSIGFILGSISLVISLIYTGAISLWILFTIKGMENIETSLENETWMEEFYQEQIPDTNFDISGYSWLAEDNSILYLEHDQNYIWYEEERNNEDNFTKGTYETYTGEDALAYLINHLELFGITEEDSNSFFKNNSYSIKNYYVLILNSEKKVTNGQEEVITSSTTYYYGTYDENTKMLSLINNSKQSIHLTLQEKLAKIDI